MKNKKKIISAILVVTVFASLLTACGKTATQGEVKQQEKRNVKAEIKSTEYDLVADGKSDYSILISDNATANETIAANELQLFTKKATGAELAIVKESNANEAGKYLSVGDTKLSQEAGIVPTHEELQYGGFVIKTVNDDCFIKGASDIGTRNGIYEWLYYCFDYECYSADEIFVKETKNMKLPAFELKYTPSFDFREAPGLVTWDDELTYRMRFNTNAEIFVTKRSCHTSYTIIDPYEYDYTSDKYKDWFSDTTYQHMHLKQLLPAQLCYSNTEWWDEYVKNLKEMLKNSDAPIMIMGMEDNPEWCECEKCTASKEQYGTDSATIIKFANYVQGKITEWYETEYPGKQPATLAIFAYHKSEKAPVKWNDSQKTYVPIDETVKLHEDLAVMYAPVNANYAYPFTAKVNESVKNNVEEWNAVTDNLLAWTYSTYPLHAFMMADSFEVMQENYKLLINNGAMSILDQEANWQKKVSTGWSHAKLYVMSKLMWNVELNMEELLDDFFANYFDIASDTMRDLFETDREWMRHIYGDLGSTGSIFEDMLKTEYYSYPVLKQAMNQIDKAYEDIEVYKESNPERYKQLYDRITLESMQYRYILINLYSTEYGANEILNMKYEFRHDVERLGITTYQENKYISELWASWGIQ